MEARPGYRPLPLLQIPMGLLKGNLPRGYTQGAGLPKYGKLAAPLGESFPRTLADCVGDCVAVPTDVVGSYEESASVPKDKAQPQACLGPVNTRPTDQDLCSDVALFAIMLCIFVGGFSVPSMNLPASQDKAHRWYD